MALTLGSVADLVRNGGSNLTWVPSLVCTMCTLANQTTESEAAAQRCPGTDSCIIPCRRSEERRQTHTSTAAPSYYRLLTETHHLPFDLRGPSPAGSSQLLMAAHCLHGHSQMLQIYIRVTQEAHLQNISGHVGVNTVNRLVLLSNLHGCQCSHVARQVMNMRLPQCNNSVTFAEQVVKCCCAPSGCVSLWVVLI